MNPDLDALERELNALRDELRSETGPEDLRHLRKVERLGRLFTLVGWATSWIAPNPLAIFGISTGIVARWTMVAHHVTHRGYDKVPDVPARLTSKHFAKGWRRVIDWMDILYPEAWRHEHNTLHHYKLGEVHDPDQPEHNLDWLRTSSLPIWARTIVLFIGALTWRWLYYPPNTMRELYEAELRRNKTPRQLSQLDLRVYLPFSRPGRDTWMRSFLPYFLFHFVMLPLPFLLIGPWAYGSVLINRILAEFLANLHTFLIIVPSHAGADLYRFDDPIEGRADFYLHQIIGSANYRTGGFLNDFFHGWLNYQIEHHVWPDMTMLQYAKAQPRVAEICASCGVPYVQESVWTRARKLVRVLVGKDTMMRWEAPNEKAAVIPMDEAALVADAEVA